MSKDPFFEGSITSFQNISEAVSYGVGNGKLLLNQHSLTAEFYNLSSGLAGELFQKCTNYQIRLALVVSIDNKLSNSFIALQQEHKQHSFIRFFNTEAEALIWLG